MPLNDERIPSRTHLKLGGPDRIISLTRVLAGLLCFALVHHPVAALGASAAGQHSVVLSWNPSTSPVVAGYHLYYGTASGDYTQNLVLGNVTSATIGGLLGGVTYYFAMTAYDTNGVESGFSNEVSFTPGAPTMQLVAVSAGQCVLSMSGSIGATYAVEATQDFMTWTNLGTITIGSGGTGSFADATAANYPQRFYRTQAQP